MGWVIKAPGSAGAPPRCEPVRYEYGPECPHSDSEVRQKHQKNGTVPARQCRTCGAHLGVVPKSQVPDVGALPEYDETARQRWCEKRAAEAQARFDAQRAARDAEWWAWYDAYLASPEWQAKRAKVLTRDGFRCRGCETRRATQVHHLTYARVGRELLFDLVSVCDECHDAAHTKEAA